MKPRRTIVVTGASAGLGRAIARRFAREEGARLGLIARDAGRLDTAKREVEKLGGQALALPLDVADAAAVEDAAARVEAEFGPIDVWVNNAMVSVFSPVRETTAEEFRRVTEVTYLGYVHGTLSALRRMRDEGIIVQVGSALAYRGIPMQSAYCAAKHAMQGFVDSLRTELLAEGSRVQVCMVQMPALNTPQFSWVKSRLSGKAQPVPPIYSPEVAADAVTWMSRHPRREMLVGWPTVKAVLGNRVTPGLVDHYLARGGAESQQRDEPEDPARPHNLWNAVPGPFGSRGEFTNRERRCSPALWISKTPGLLRAVGLGIVVGVVWSAFGTLRRAA